MDERAVFERHAERVLQFFVNKVRAPSDASDLAQETFARFFERARRGDVRSERAFLFGVANLVLKEYWKAKARQPEPLEPGDRSVSEMGVTQTTLGTRLARRESHGRMLLAMQQLRLDYQNVLELYYWHELKYEEIAEVLGQNPSTIGVWLRRAKQALARALEELPAVDEALPRAPEDLDRWLRESGSLAREAASAPEDSSA
ncbi:MAG: RNA polymerase sigma factor [Myxococcales bacterium]|nr:RNA polymerase sigma factor [Myxococcales bacterium]